MRIDLTIVNTSSFGVKKYYHNYSKYFTKKHKVVKVNARSKLILHLLFNLKYVFYNRQIHTWFPTGIIPIFASNFSVTIHDVIPLQDTRNYNIFYRFYFRQMLKIKLKHASNVYFVSKTAAEEIRSILNIDLPFKITYNFIDSCFQTHHKTHMCIPDQYFLFVGNFAKHKGLERLLSLWEKQAYLLVCLIDKANSNCANYGDMRNVVFLDKCDESSLVFLYSNCKGLLFPSSHEGFGIPGMEANSLNRRVIYNNISVFKEIFSFTERNLCFDFYQSSSEDLARILEACVSDFQLNATIPKYFLSPNELIEEC